MLKMILLNKTKGYDDTEQIVLPVQRKEKLG